MKYTNKEVDMKEKWIVFKKDWFRVFCDELSDKEAGILFKAIFKYQLMGDHYDKYEIFKTQNSSAVRVAWCFLLDELEEMFGNKGK